MFGKAAVAVPSGAPRGREVSIEKAVCFQGVGVLCGKVATPPPLTVALRAGREHGKYLVEIV